jgi:hypothetical protein
LPLGCLTALPRGPGMWGSVSIRAETSSGRYTETVRNRDKYSRSRVVTADLRDRLVQADNPGSWMTHCHNVYHGEAGMMIALIYRT